MVLAVLGDWILFWKKRTTNKPVIDLAADHELREAFRINPQPQLPVLLFVGTAEIEVNNISIGGLAFKAKGFNVGKRYSIRLQLPNLSTPLHCKIEVVDSDKALLCRCRFVELSDVSLAKIQQYVLVREKQQIRASGPKSAENFDNKEES